MESLQARERRVGRRLPCVVPVRELGAQGGSGRALSLSMGGLYFQRFGGRPLEAGERLALELQLPDGHRVRAVGEVVSRVDELFYMGGRLKFTWMDRADEDRLDRYIEITAGQPAHRGVAIGRMSPAQIRA